MLRNEKYMGDALLQKTITTDFIEKVRIKNDGSAPQYYVKDSQEAIIPRDIYIQAQEEMARRANMASGKDGKKRRVYSSKYALSSICICAKCGDVYRRIAWNNRGKHYIVWRCCNRVENGPKACDADTVRETELQGATVKAINQMVGLSDTMIDRLMENIRMALADDNTGELETLNSLMAEKQKELVRLAHAKKDYTDLAIEIDNLREKKQGLLAKRAERKGMQKRIQEMEEFLRSQPEKLTEYDEQMVRRYIQEIIISDDNFKVKFKAGMEVDIAR